MFQLLDITSTCSDYAIVKYLMVIQNALNIIHIVVPIILLVMLTVQFTKMMINPDDKKGFGALKNKIIATVLIFLMPYIVNLVIGLIPDSFSVSKCWDNATTVNDKMK